MINKLDKSSYHRKWVRENLDKVEANSKRWKSKNPEYGKLYREINKEKLKEYRIKNKARIRAKQKIWEEKHKKEKRLSDRLRYNRLKISIKKNVKDWREKVFYSNNRKSAMERDGGKCVICGSKNKLVCHHKDGTGYRASGRIGRKVNNKLSNLIILCNSCHIRIHSKRRYPKGSYLGINLRK